MWSRTIDGQVLRFRLLGVNNQNFLMVDEQTGSWWQQVTGEAVQGPLAGKRLTQIASDQVRLVRWRQEHPTTAVLAVDPRLADRYLPDDWESRVAEVPAPPAAQSAARIAGGLKPRELIVGVEVEGQAKAYAMAVLEAQSPIADMVGGVPILIVLDDDGRSVRCFERRIEGRTLELFRQADAASFALVDAETGSAWDFAGHATAGPLEGQTLAQRQTLLSYWFDWHNHHPATAVFAARGLPAPAG